MFPDGATADSHGASKRSAAPNSGRTSVLVAKIAGRRRMVLRRTLHQRELGEEDREADDND